MRGERVIGMKFQPHSVRFFSSSSGRRMRRHSAGQPSVNLREVRSRITSLPAFTRSITKPVGKMNVGFVHQHNGALGLVLDQIFDMNDVSVPVGLFGLQT